MSMPIPPAEAAPLVVPFHDALVAVAVLVILALASNLALYAYLTTQSTLSAPPSPARGECVWEKGPGDEGPGEASTFLPSLFSPRPLAGEGPGVRVPGGGSPSPGRGEGVWERGPGGEVPGGGPPARHHHPLRHRPPRPRRGYRHLARSRIAAANRSVRDARAIPEEVTLIGETDDTLTPPVTVEILTTRDWNPNIP